jgi:hypothetical protein
VHGTSPSRSARARLELRVVEHLVDEASRWRWLRWMREVVALRSVTGAADAQLEQLA